LITITVAILLGSGAALAASNACKADLTADGVVNFADLAVLKSVFFQSCSTPPRFEDGGETVFDHQTGLEWEKKTDDGGIHDMDNRYPWSTGTNNPDGTAFTVFLAALNGGAALGVSADGLTSSGPCYAGHCDWRLPTIGELRTIVDCSHGSGPGTPCVDPIFGPTQTNAYWSSSSLAGDPLGSWSVGFNYGSGSVYNKTLSLSVRAIRGGSD
jgi:hypothetical protein